MNDYLIDPKHILATVVFACVGILLLVVAVWVLDKLTPKNLWTEIIDNKNTALGITAAGLMIGIAIIVAAALHG